MGSRGPSAQYAYGVTVEFNKDYQKELKTLSDGLEDLEKKIKSTQKSFSSGIQSSGNKGFEQVQRQTAEIVESIDRLLQLEKEFGGVNAPKIFDGLKQNRDDIAKLSGSIKDIRENFAALSDTVKSLPSDLFSRLSDLFVYDEKGATGKLKNTAEAIKGIINGISKSTDKEKLGSLMGQLTQMVSEFQIGLTQATDKGWDVGSKALAKTLTELKGMLPQLSTAGDGFDSLAQKIVGFYNVIGQQYRSKHPTGKSFFTDIATDASNAQSKVVNATSKTVASLNAIIQVVDKLKKSDMGLSGKSKELEDFLAKLQNPEITIKVNKNNILSQVDELEFQVEDLLGKSIINLTPDFLKTMPVEQLTALGDALQNIIAIRSKYPNVFNQFDHITPFGPAENMLDAADTLRGYQADLNTVMTELENRLNATKESVQQLSNQLQSMLEKAGLKEIKLELGVPAEEEVETYVAKINAFIDKLINSAMRIKKIPLSIAFDSSKSTDANGNEVDPAATLKQQLESLKDSIHNTRGAIETDARELKRQLLDMLKFNKQDVSNINTAFETLFNENPIQLYVDGEFLINQIETILKSRTFNISANIAGATYSGGSAPVSSSTHASGAAAAETQKDAANTQTSAASDQTKAASENASAAEDQKEAAREQKSAAEANNTSAKFMSKSTSQLTAFVKSFGELYAKALSVQQALNKKIANGETVNERSLRMANGKVNKLTPMANYLQDIFGKDTDLAKITEEYVANILTGLLQKNATTGGFKGELLEVTLSSLLKGWKGSYKNQTALLAPLLGSNGTLNSLFKAMGLSAISESEKVNRDYNAPEMLKFYQKFAKLADVLNMLKLGKGDTKQLLSELRGILKDLRSTTSSEEYKANIDEIRKSIITLRYNTKQYDKQVVTTQDLARGNESPYTTLLNMFKQFYGTASAEAQNFLNAAIGANPSDVNISGNMLSKAKEAMLHISGDDASSKIANDIVHWLDRMIARDNVIVSRQTLLDQLGKGAEGAGLKIATSKDMLRKAGNGASKNSQLQASAAGIAHAILKSLDADIYIDGNDTPITLTGKAVTSKIESLLSISKGAKLGAKTQFYSKDNKRPAPLDLSQIKASDEYSIDWEERLAVAEENVQKSAEQLVAAKQARDTRLSELTQNEETLNQQIQAARESVNAAQEALNNVQPISYAASPEIESLKSDYKKQKEIYDLMAKGQYSVPNTKKLRLGVSEDYVSLLRKKQQLEAELKTAESLAESSKKYASDPELLNRTITQNQKREKVLQREIKSIESRLAGLTKSKDIEGNEWINAYEQQLEEYRNELIQVQNRLSIYSRIQNGEDISDELTSSVKEKETTLQQTNEQIEQLVVEQKQKLDSNLFEQLQLTIEQYKQRQQELSDLDKSLKKETPGTTGYDKIAAQIQTAKESLNGLFDSITDLANNLGLSDIDLKDLFAGMDKQSFYNSKNARDSLKLQIDALKQFKNSENFDLSNLEIFPKELQTLLQQRAELFNEKSNYDNAKAELKDYKQRLKEATLKGNTEIQSILQRRVDALQGYIDNARPKKEINADISNLNSVIRNYISSIIQQYGTYIKKSKISFQKYDIGDGVVEKYTSTIESQRSSLIPLTEQKKAIDLEKESLDNQVKTAESRLKAAERTKQVAQLQVEYNKKKDEELALIREINRLEEAGASPTILSEKTQALSVINAEVADLYNKLKEINGINFSNVFDDSLSPEQKKLTALEKIQELQKIIIQNNEKIAQLDTYTKDVKKAQNLAFNKEQSSFTTLYGNRSTTADNLKKMFVAHYTSTDEYQEYKTSLYAKAQEKTNELSNALTKRISEVVDSVYQNALSTFIQSKYGEDGAYLHSRAWDIGQATIEQEIREAIEARLIAINNEESAAIEEIVKNKSLSTDEIISEISRISKIYDKKRASLTSGEEIKNIISQKAPQFFNAYYDNLEQLLIEKFGESFTDDKLKGELKSILSGMILTAGKGKDQVETVFGKRISNVLNQAEEVEKTIIPKMYEAINKKLAERIITYLGTISEDMTRAEGEVAADKVFTDGKGFRVNLAKLYREKNAYFLGIKESLERESKDAELLIERYKAYGGISKEEIARIAEARDRAYLKLYGGSSSDIQNLDLLIGDVDYTPIAHTIQNGAQQVVKKTSEIAQQAIEQGIANAGATDTTTAQAPQLKNIAEMSKKELEKEMAAAIQTLTERAQDAANILSDKNGSSSTAKSKNVYGSQYNGALNPILGNDIRTASQFQNLIVSLMDAINNGINIGKQNVEYGFTEKNGQKVEFAIGDIEEVIFKSIYDDIDVMTHSHAYRKGLNNFVLSLGDIDQLSDVASEGKLKKYNMIYGREMMSIDLGKDSYGTALNIANKYPIINDVITAMFSTVNGEDIAAQNSDEMARIFNGYLQRMVQEAGGSLSIKDISTGADIRNKYAVTDEEYSKLNAVIAQLTPYYNKVSNGTISVSTQEYVNAIRDVLSQAFGKDFISSLVNREYDRARGGITSEYSALSGATYNPISDLFAKFLSRSKGALNYHDVYSQMSDEQIMERLQQLRAAIGETIDSTENKVKQTLTKSQINMLNPDSISAWTKRSIKDTGKVFNWDNNNYADIYKVLGKDNATIAQYQTELQTLKEIANDIRAKGANGTVITDADLQRLDDAVAKVKALQTELAKSAKIQSAYQTLEKEGRIVSGDSKISDNMLFTDRQAVMEAYAKQYAASKNSQYNFSQYDFVNDKISFDMIDADGKVTSVVMAWGEAFNSAYIQAEKLQGSCDDVTTSIHKINQAIVDGQKEGFFDKNSKEMQAYQSALDAYGKAQEAVRNSTANNLEENINKLKAAQEELVKLGNGILGKSKNAYGYNSATKVLNREETVKQSLATYQDQSINVDNLKIVKDYYAALDALKRKKDELAQSGKLLSNENGEQAALKVLADRATEAENALLKAHEAQLKINNDKITGERANFFENVNPQDINAVKNAMMSYVNSIQGASFKNFNAETRTMTYEIKHGKNEVQEMTMVMGELGNAVAIIPGKIKPVESGFQSFIGGIKKKFKEVATYFTTFGSIYRLWSILRRGFQYVKEIDSALTELKKVTDETNEVYARFLNTAAKTGAEIGTTISEFVNATADFARLNI